MAHSPETMIPDLFAAPFGERSEAIVREPLPLQGARFQFESNGREVLRLVESAYTGLPRHRLSAAVPRLRVGLLLTSGERLHRRSEPPPIAMLSGGGFPADATGWSDFAVISPRERAELVVMSPHMFRFPHHAGDEVIDFAVFTLAAYATSQPEWAAFRKSVSGLGAFELRRGKHPLEAVEVLRELLGPRAPRAG